jgi:hypothetical protein
VSLTIKRTGLLILSPADEHLREQWPRRHTFSGGALVNPLTWPLRDGRDANIGPFSQRRRVLAAASQFAGGDPARLSRAFWPRSG